MPIYSTEFEQDGKTYSGPRIGANHWKGANDELRKLISSGKVPANIRLVGEVVDEWNIAMILPDHPNVEFPVDEPASDTLVVGQLPATETFDSPEIMSGTAVGREFPNEEEDDDFEEPDEEAEDTDA